MVEMWSIRIAYIIIFLTIVILATRHSRKRHDEHEYLYHEEQPTMTNNITLELHSLKELIVLRKTVQDRMNLLQAAESTMPYKREETIEYLTLGQILVRLPDPATLTPQTCTQEDIPS